MSLHKEYINLGNGLELKMSISFSKGGRNWSTGNDVAKGYRGHIIPVKRRTEENFTIETSGAFTGFNVNLLNVQRQSAKRLAEAIKILKGKKENYLQYWKDNYEPQLEESGILAD